MIKQKRYTKHFFLLIYLVKQCQQDTNSFWLDMHLDNIHLDNKTEITIWLDNN